MRIPEDAQNVAYTEVNQASYVTYFSVGRWHLAPSLGNREIKSPIFSGSEEELRQFVVQLSGG